MLDTTMTVLIAVTSALILICHALAVFGCRTTSAIFGGINIFLHISLVAFMLVRGIELEWLVLTFMTSLLAYVAMFAANAKFHTGEGIKEENDDI